MQIRAKIRLAQVAAVCLLTACVCAGQDAASGPEVIDRVVAVVNNRAILASDVETEMRLSVLEPSTSNEKPDPRDALDRLISRALIQQQIRREDLQAAEPSDKDIQDRIEEVRRQLPACVRAHCETDEGWAEFLRLHMLNDNRVKNYFRLRLEVLSFIENRFGQGIRISPEEIEAYYKEKLLPQYPAGEPAPSLESVSDRIEEILLQDQVNKMFGAWLDNLRKQGDVEVLDPSLEKPGEQSNESGGQS